MDTARFWVARSLRVPGLGLLLLPAAPLPPWLLTQPLHTALRLRLHRPGHPPQALPATLEELHHDSQAPTRAVLLDADPAGVLGPDAWLELLEIPAAELL